jgi:hypothetical protein
MPSSVRRRAVAGVDFVVGEDGERKSVLIDLKRHGDLREDFYDALVAKRRRRESREPLHDVKRRVLGKR